MLRRRGRRRTSAGRRRPAEPAASHARKARPGRQRNAVLPIAMRCGHDGAAAVPARRDPQMVIPAPRNAPQAPGIERRLSGRMAAARAGRPAPAGRFSPAAPQRYPGQGQARSCRRARERPDGGNTLCMAARSVRRTELPNSVHSHFDDYQGFGDLVARRRTRNFCSTAPRRVAAIARTRIVRSTRG